MDRRSHSSASAATGTLTPLQSPRLSASFPISASTPALSTSSLALRPTSFAAELSTQPDEADAQSNVYRQDQPASRSPSASSSAPSTVSSRRHLTRPLVEQPAGQSSSSQLCLDFVDAEPPALWTGPSPVQALAELRLRKHRMKQYQATVEPLEEELGGGYQCDTSSHHNQTSRLQFLDLPPEIRDQVYSWVLCPKVKPISPFHNVYEYNLSILRTCKSVYQEARHVFRKQNVFVKIETPWPQAEQHTETEGLVPLIAIGEMAERFQHPAFRAVIEAAGMYRGEEMHRFVVRLEDLDKFCKMWYYSDLTHLGLNSHLAVRLLTTDMRKLFPELEGRPESELQMPKWAQEAFFKPFGKVKGLHSVAVEGVHDKAIVQEMKDIMAIPYDTAEHCIEEALRLKNLGNEELRQGRYQSAIDCYTESFRAMHILVDGQYRRICGDAYFDNDLKSGTFKGQRGYMVRMVLRIKLVANFMQAYLKMEKWEDAYFWGMRSINLRRESMHDEDDLPHPWFPAAAEWGKIYYRTGLAAKKLDKPTEARELFRTAGMWLPGDESVKREIAATALRLG